MKIIVPIENEKCPKCLDKLASNLSKVENIEKVLVNYDTKELTILSHGEIEKETIDKILGLLKENSHCEEHKKVSENAKIVKDEYYFEDIDCAMCAKEVEEELNKDKNILSARVNFLEKTMIITHSDKVDIFDTAVSILGKVEDGATLYKEKPGEKETKHKVVKLCLFIGGVALLLAAILLQFLAKVPMYVYLPMYLLSYVALGYEILYKSVVNLFHGKLFDENFLMVFASIAAFFLQEFYEGIMIILLYNIGEAIQDRAVDESTKQIKKLMDVKVDTITLEDGSELSVKEATVGTRFVVKVGDRIALDGKIVKGTTEVDMKALTGESLPVLLKENDEILSGSINLTKAIVVEATALDSESTMSKVIKMVEEASSKKSHTEEFITKFAKIYTPIVIGLAILVFGIWAITTKNISDSLNNALVFLVSSCPCALVISIPLGYYAGIGRSSKSGILVRGGNYLEALTKVERVVMDKTGTLTEGNFKIRAIHSSVLSEKELLQLVASVESFSTHPIAKSIVAENELPLRKEEIQNLQEKAGYGLSCQYMGNPCYVGNEKLMKEQNLSYTKPVEVGSVLYINYDHVDYGSIIIRDEPKKNALSFISYLNQAGIKSTMLTGDNDAVAQDMSKELGINEVYSSLLPDQKLEHLQTFLAEKQNKKTVVYMGDGINDAPALRLADVGIAMGACGTDVAKEVADVIIMNDDIGKVEEALAISKKTKEIVYENLLFVFVIKIITLIIGALGILGKYAIFLAIFADVGVCLLAVLNTLRILNWKRKGIKQNK